MEQVVITKPDGSLVPIANKRTATKIKSAKQNWALLANDTVSMEVESPFPQKYNIGDQIIVFGRLYKLNRLPKMKKTGMREFSYSLEFEGVQYDLIRATYDLTIDTTNNSLQDVQADSLTGDLRKFATVLMANANRVFPGKWVLGTCPNTDTKTLTFGEDDNCLTATQNFCTEFGVEFDIVQSNGVFTMNFVEKVGQIFPYTFEFGKGKGLYALDRQNVDSSNIVTRLKVYGSTSNITSKYRANRLCLYGKTKAQSYIEKADAVAKYGIFEATKYFDNIKPTFQGSVTGVVSGNVLQFIDTKMFDLNALEADGETTKYLIDGCAAKVHFNTGNLAGYEFEVHAYDHATHTFTLVKQTDERGDVFPSASSVAFQFAKNDEYKLLDVALPDQYTEAAETKLGNEGEKYYNQNCQPKVQYGLSVTKSFLEKMVGSGTTQNFFSPGDYIPIKDTDIDVDKSVRIQSFTRNLLDEYDYTLTISDTVKTDLTNRVISELTDIDKIININNLKDPAQARANWRSSREVMSMVFDPEGDYYTDKIKPNSIDTLALSVGAKSMQFGLTNTVFQPNYNGNKNLVRVQGGVLTHYTIDEEKAISWVLADGQTTLNGDTQAYYIYAKCQRAGTSGSIIFSKDQIRVDQDAMYYHFWIGVVNSVDSELHARSIALSYGFTMINGRFIKTGRIESADGLTYFDLDNSEIGGRIVFTSNGQEKTLEELGNESLESKNYINNTLPGILDEIQAQLDGQIEQFFYTYDPTTSNAPANTWTTTAKKEEHLGDLFYNTDNGKVFRWVKNGNVYSWQQLQDSEVAQALALANDALALAKTKRRIFTSTPYPPYEIGDLWVQGVNGDIMRCKTTRASGSYSSGDWEKASNYTNDSAFNDFINNTYNSAISDLTKQIDGKIESWFQTADPETSWTTNAIKGKHVGDTWFDKSTNILRFYLSGNIQSFINILTKNKVYFWKKTVLPSGNNVPASTWTSTALKDTHLGDIYYVPNSNRLYTYVKNVINNISVYEWNEIVDENICYTLRGIHTLLNDGIALNRTVPTIPYTKNDCFFNSTNVLIANTSRTSGSYVPNDWTAKGNLFYYWQRTKDQTAIDAYNAASNAQDTADGKRRVFVSTPYPPYDVGDLWVDGTQLRRCATKKVSGQSYNVNDWVTCVTYDNTKTVIDGGLVTSGTIQVAGSTTTILAGMTGQGTAESSIRFWAGASFENRATAPFRVLQDGSVVMTKATVEGIIKAISGSIGGFEIDQGRIGVSDDRTGTSDGLSLLSSFIKYSIRNTYKNIWAGIGSNVLPSSSGATGLARFEYTDGYTYGNNVISLLARCRPGYQHPWYTQQAINYDGNLFGIGGKAEFDDTYIGQAYTDILEEYLGQTHQFFFSSISSSYLNVRLPGRSLINGKVSSRVVSFLLYIQIGYLGNSNRIKIYGCDDGVLVDNNANRINGGNGSLDMAQGDSMILRYCNGHYYLVQYRT